jgi:hypothetical protein
MLKTPNIIQMYVLSYGPNLNSGLLQITMGMYRIFSNLIRTFFTVLEG